MKLNENETTQLFNRAKQIRDWLKQKGFFAGLLVLPEKSIVRDTVLNENELSFEDLVFGLCDCMEYIELKEKNESPCPECKQLKICPDSFKNHCFEWRQWNEGTC